MRIRNLEALAGGGAQHQPASADTGTGTATLDRRSFLKLTTLAGSGLALGVAPVLAGAQDAKAKPPSPPQAFIIIAPDNTVTVAVNRLEFGQGVHTALPMALAEELDVDWRNVRGMLAPAADPYKDPGFGIQMTGGSTALNHSFEQYRELGARARAMLVSAAAQRWKVEPSTCRVANGVITSGSNRATYGELAQAAMALPVPAQVTLKNPSQFHIVGKPTPRLDARAKLDSSLKFGLDTRLPNMKVAVLARPPRFGGKVAKYDAAAAKAVKGVVDVLQIPTDRGGTGVAVIADGYWPAKQGRDALQITWEDAGSTVSTPALMAEYKKLAGQPGTVAKAADVSAIQSASKRIQAEYEFPYLAHAPMEPLNCTIDVQNEGGKPGGKIIGAKAWVGSQFQTVDQGAIAKVLGVPPEKVELNTMMAGGGFGRRAVPTSDYLAEAANVAKAYAAAGHDGPVKVIWSREDDIRGGYYRPMQLHRVSVGVDNSGKVVGWDHMIVGQSILKGTPFEAFMVKNGVDSTMVEGVIENDYGFPMQVTVHHPDVNVPVLWWRSVGHTHTAYVMETMVDEVAHAARQDPVAFRMARFTGKEHERHRAALQLAVDKSGYGKRKLPKGQAWGVAVHASFESVVAYIAEVSVEQGKPRVHRVTAGVHANRVVNPMGAEAQIQGACVFGLAMIQPGFAIDIENGATKNSNFPDFPPVRMPDAPPVNVFFVPSEDNPTGLGEPGVPPIAPAVANAVFTLTGKRLRKLPFDTV